MRLGMRLSLLFISLFAFSCAKLSLPQDPPDVLVCADLSPKGAVCTRTITGGDFDYSQEEWDEIRSEFRFQVTSEGLGELIRFIRTVCSEVKCGDKEVELINKMGEYLANAS